MLKVKIEQEQNNSQLETQQATQENSEKEKFSNLNYMKQYLDNAKIFKENCELLNFIDTGSESVVYHGMLQKYKKDVILKIILKNKRQRENLREIHISSKLKYKNIISFYGYMPLIKNESSCILMEYARHGNLRNFQKKILKRSILSESLLCFFASQILQGLNFCVRNRIVHMDIKPQNIVIDCFLNLKLIDFSISINYK